MIPDCAKALVFITLLIAAVSAPAADWAPDFPVGSSVMPISALDQHEQQRDFENLKGAKGLLLLFNRSTTW